MNLAHDAVSSSSLAAKKTKMRKNRIEKIRQISQIRRFYFSIWDDWNLPTWIFILACHRCAVCATLCHHVRNDETFSRDPVDHS